MRALLQTPLDADKARCDTCAWRCVLSPGQVGVCRVRANVQGRIVYLAQGMFTETCPKVSTCNAGTFCTGQPSCNWSCTFCSSAPATLPELEPVILGHGEIPFRKDGFLDRKALQGPKVMPFPNIASYPRRTSADVVAEWKASGKRGFAVRLTEPSIHLESCIEIFSQVHAEDGFVMIGTNAFWTPETVEALAPHVDQVEVGIKGSANPTFLRNVAGVPRVEPIFDTITALAGYDLDLAVLDVPVFHEGWQDDVTNLVRFIRDTIPDRGLPRYKLSAWGGRIPYEAFGDFLPGLPIETSEGIDVSPEALVIRAGLIGLGELPVVMFDLPNASHHATLSWFFNDFPHVIAGSTIRVGRTEADLDLKEGSWA